MVRLTSLLIGILLASLACGSPGAFGQDGAADYPSRAVHIVVGFPPGGGADGSARVVAEKLSQRWGKPVIVENKAGAQGNLAMASVAKSAPDGYTLALVPLGNAAVNPSLFKKLPYSMSEFAPISQIAVIENVLVVNASSPAKTLKELIALGKADGADFTYSSPGAGSQAHLAGELLARATGLKMRHIPYRGLSPALTDVLSGVITMTFAQLSTAKALIEQGQLRALGVASKQRSPALPDLPTVAEAGDIPGFEAVSWYALMAPAQTPPTIIRKLSSEVAEIVRMPEVIAALEALGATPVGNTPEELAKIIENDTARWARVIKEAGITPQ